MPDFTEKIRAHVVTVNTGSGVLIQPADADFTYILTAKHVIETAKNSGVYFSAEEIVVTKYNGEVIALQDRRICAVTDLAVIISNDRLDAEVQPAISKPQREDRVLYYGYPQTRRGTNQEDRLREYGGEVTENPENSFTLMLDGQPEWAEVAGSSGGGVFKIIGEDIFLYGVESRVEGAVGREFHGKVVCSSMSAVESLIEKEGIPKIYPVAMSSFIGLVERSFEYYNRTELPDNLNYLKGKLHDLANNLGLAGSVSPLDLYHKFRSGLLIRNSLAQDLYSTDLWISYLEYLIISCLIDDVQNIDVAYVNDNNSRRRFLYSADKGVWARRLMDIFRSDFRGLKRKGKVVISTGDISANMQVMKPTLDGIVPNIGRSDASELMVDAGITNPAKEFDVYHLTGLHRECILRNEHDLAKYYAGNDAPGYGPDDLMTLVRSLYSEHI
ncbi:hypothetical protein DNJ95_06495 [Stutzerimonas kirkiae]|uniref:ABC-three component systems C-terminal domain-containing protein n=1 Tax=Stutzerimonas kirkiae TaxID=2211392 RepID=A0A4V2KDE2_9GAMM|nr:ABC-three component system protein [Stutzerimonas kirkiae]TBU98895.1 hypothetical protein DNJ96_04085 [Stutzerimonas kirkiae]TBV03989.1 hypothetical protein DNJ95_06495 [Stutzerimonas kirkiae]